jgi:choline dehydrogenase-like flavoprotein
VQLIPEAVAWRLELDDNRVARVHYRRWDGSDATISGKIVVLAANAIETPRLLLLSAPGRGIANSSDQVGRNLMDHLELTSDARMPDPVYPYRGPPTTSGIHALRDGDFRRYRGAMKMSINNDGQRTHPPYGFAHDLVMKEGLFGDELRRRLAELLTRGLRVSCSVEVLPRSDNRVTLSETPDALGLHRPRLSFTMDEYTSASLDLFYDVCTTIYRALGAQRLAPPAPESGKYNGAGHIMGTARMGDDPKSSVVDAQCRTHDCSNLFILGGSVFPTCGTANPTLTIAALALRAAPVIAGQLRQS